MESVYFNLQLLYKNQFHYTVFQKVKDFLVSNTFEYKATQNKLSFPILFRIYKKLKIGVKFSEIKIGDNIAARARRSVQRMAEIGR